MTLLYDNIYVECIHMAAEEMNYFYLLPINSIVAVISSALCGIKLYKKFHTNPL